MKIRDLTIAYPQSKPLFNGLNLDIEPASYTLICGPTGSGKSSLALALAGCSGATITGTIDAPPSAIVWQDPGAQMCGRSLLDEVRLPMDYRNIDATVSTECAFELLETTRLAHVPPDRDPMKLSGGEQQRLAFAAALAQDTSVVILDEATSQLDQPSREEFIQALTSHTHKTILAIDHNIEPHLPYMDRMIILGPEGTIVWDDTMPPPPSASFGVRLPGLLPRRQVCTPAAEQQTIDLGFAEFPFGAVVALTGPNGAGKTTQLLQLTRNKALLRSGIAWLPQRGSHYLLRNTVEDELGDTITAHTIGLDGLEHTHPLALSGGQRQRLALAHALSEFDGALALLDEPSYSQDFTGTEQIINLIAAQAGNRVTLMATHDELLIHALATHVVEMRDGHINDIRIHQPNNP